MPKKRLTKLQGSVATYLRYGWVVNRIKKGLMLSLSVRCFFKSVNIWQSYKQERGCLVLNDEENAQDKLGVFLL